MITRSNGRVNNSLRAKSEMRWYEFIWYLQLPNMWWQMKTAFSEALPFFYNIVMLIPVLIIMIPNSFMQIHKARKEMKQYETS